MLSPFLRHRLVLEKEVLEAVLARFSPSTVDKFISEVFWRAYFKGYLERRPSIWHAYRRDVAALQERMARDTALAADVAAAEAGQTGIDAFDSWARELAQTGYLHNHARMWFASIWIFTLRLPWQLGADFFLRHLLDGDPASNTLSWRWVGGLHTRGKTYLARADNIARYTNGRFFPRGLAAAAEPLEEDESHPLRPVPGSDPLPRGPVLWLITEDDCAPETRQDGLEVAGFVATRSTALRSPRPVSRDVAEFTDGAVTDAAQRLADFCGASAARPVPRTLDADKVIEAAHAAGVDTVATSYCPLGPAAEALSQARPKLEAAGLGLVQLQRTEDPPAWERADRGFFKVKKAIPSLLPA
jgi:deoxyribodipyrimidine photo-lyase